MQSGPHIIDIRNAISSFCLSHDMAAISRMLTLGTYEEYTPPTVDPTKIGNDNDGNNRDPFGLYIDSIKAAIKQTSLAELAYNKSKEKLLGLLISITSKELEDKLKILFTGQIADRTDKAQRISANGGTALQIETALGLLPTINPDDPLQTWTNIVYLVTTKASGNKRIDQDAANVAFANLKQRQGESILDYGSRADNIIEAFKLLDLTPPSPPTMAMRFTQGLDPAKYGSMQNTFTNELHFGRDLYPVDLASAISNASKYQPTSNRGHETAYPHTVFGALKASKPLTKIIRKDQDKGKAKPTDRSRPPKPSTDRPKCLYCGRTGHDIIDCFKLLAAQASAKSDGAHDKKKAAVSINTSTLDFFDEEDTKFFTSHVTSKRLSPMARITALLPVFPEAPLLDNSHVLLAKGPTGLRSTDVILDSGANFSIIANPDLLSDTRSCSTVVFDGLNGTLSIDKKGCLQGLCDAYFHTAALANILSFSQVRSLGHHIAYNSHKDSFTLSPTTYSRAYEFLRRPNGLYVADMALDDHLSGHIATVAENEARHSKRDVTKAKLARQLQRRLGNPPDAKLKRALSLGQITHSDILPIDITRATEIYGPNLESLKGRTTYKKATPFPAPVTPTRVTDEQRMYVDLFYACKEAFLITKVLPLGHTMVTALDKADTSSLRRVLRTHLGTYGQRHIRITAIYSDNERGITAMALDFAGAGITLHQCGPGMHVQIIERCIRYIKELARGLLAGLPYNCPIFLFRLLVVFVTTRSNMFPDSTRTDGLSPFQLLYNRTPNAKFDANLEFGCHYQYTARDPDNTMTPRTYGAIGVAQIPNGTGTCKLYSLHTRKIISANHFKEIPMSEELIAHMNALAAKDIRPTDPDPVFTFHGHDITGPADIDDPPAADGDLPTPPPTILHPIMDIEMPDSTAPAHHQPPEFDSPIRQQNPIESPQLDFRGDSDSDMPINTDISNDNDPDDPEMPELIDDYDSDDDLPPPLKRPHHTTSDVQIDNTVKNATPDISTSPRRNPARSRKPPDRLNLSAVSNNKSNNLSAYHITARRAMKEIPELAEPAILLELSNLLKKRVFTGRHFHSLSKTQQASVIRSAMNVTQKVAPTSDGSGRTKDKVKARLVGGGDGQDRNHYTRADTSSPTVSISAIFIIAQLAAAERRTVVTLDIGSAYLNAAMPKDDPSKLVFMRISPDIAALIYKLDSHFAQFRAHDGSLVVELDQALYGCIQSALLWHTELSTFLRTLGFLPNDTDPCVYNRSVNNIQITIAVYVDDLIITCILTSLITELTSALRAKYKEIKVVEGLIHNYLGMVLDFSNAPLIAINQTGMIEDVVNTTLTALNVNATKIPTTNTAASPKSPAASYLFDITVASPALPPTQQAEFHSTVAKILFISHRTRPDVLTTISFLTKRVLAPTTEDWNKLRRLLQYLSATKSDCLILQCDLPPRVQLYADSSFGVHPDYKSHSGVCTTLGRGAFYSKSTVQKLVTTSSCQAELVAVAKGLQQGIFASYLLTGQGYKHSPMIVYQDNMSTIKLIENGRANSELTRHISIGYFWANDLIHRDIITVIYCPTGDMIADFLTKPLQGSLYTHLRHMLMGTSPIPPKVQKK